MAPIVLTPHQTEAVQFLTDHLHDGDPIVALRGLAGTGKTSLIPALIDVLEQTGIPVTLGAPTHRAAMVLKKKGLPHADTVHAHALTPYFTGDYTKALRWLGGSCQCRLEDLANAQAAVDGVPWLVVERLKVTGHTPEVVKARARQHEPKKALESIGITGRSHFAGFGPKCGEGVLIIDEASMVGADMLKLCQEAFPQICLVGDPGQLPPVKDAAMLAGVPGFELTEVHRQAKDSRIVQLAYAARYGEKFWESIPCVAGEVEEYTAVDAARFLEAPLVVWRNKTRLECTAAIRAALGYPTDALQIGEPLVCRSNDPQARADGLFNNSLWRVVDTGNHAKRHVTIVPDGAEEAEPIKVLIHMEETDGDNIDPEAILFRYGYCLTAHTAQGGEWPTVYISKPDLFAHSKRRPKDGEEDDFARWAYTAITRAKQTLGFLRKHDFTTTTSVAPTPWVLPHRGDDAMPKMQQTPTVAPPSAPMLTLDNEPDDIPEATLPPGMAEAMMDADTPGVPLEAPRMAQEPSSPVTPPSVPPTVPGLPDAFLPLAHGFCQYLQARLHGLIAEEHHHWMSGFDGALAHIRAHMETVLQSSEHAAYQLSDALLQVREHGVTIHGSPYEMTLQVSTPAGVPLTLTIRKGSAAELLDELTRLESWMAAQGYRGERAAEVAF